MKKTNCKHYICSLINYKMEIWKKINNHNDYEISSFGRVRSFKLNKERILKAGELYLNSKKNYEDMQALPISKKMQ